MKLFRLVYMSERNPDVNLGQIVRIVEDSQIRNQSRHLTGALCAQQHFFVQVLEGKSLEINELFQKISLDSRHHNIQLLSVKPIQNRLFENWNMRFIYTDVLQEIQDIRNLNPQINADYSQEDLDVFVVRLSELFRRTAEEGA